MAGTRSCLLRVLRVGLGCRELKSPGKETGSMSKWNHPFLAHLSWCPRTDPPGMASQVIPGCGAPAPTGLWEPQALGAFVMGLHQGRLDTPGYVGAHLV